MIVRLYKRIENFWFGFNQKLRFLLVGGFNTVFAYALFAFLVEICLLPYQTSLIIQYIIGVNVSILTMGYYVFRHFGDFKKTYVKAWSVYLFLLAANYAWMFVLVDYGKVNSLEAQAGYVVVSTVVLYVLHQRVTFKA